MFANTSRFDRVADASKGLELNQHVVRDRSITVKVHRIHYTLRPGNYFSAEVPRDISGRGTQKNRRMSSMSQETQLNTKPAATLNVAYSPQDARSDLPHQEVKDDAMATGSPGERKSKRQKPVKAPEPSREDRASKGVPGPSMVPKDNLQLDAKVVAGVKDGTHGGQGNVVKVAVQTTKTEKNTPTVVTDRPLTGDKLVPRTEKYRPKEPKNAHQKKNLTAKNAPKGQLSAPDDTSIKTSPKPDNKGGAVSPTVASFSQPETSKSSPAPSSPATLTAETDHTRTDGSQNASVSQQHDSTQQKPQEGEKPSDSVTIPIVANEPPSDDDQKNDSSFHSAREEQPDPTQDLPITTTPLTREFQPSSPSTTAEPAHPREQHTASQSTPSKDRDTNVSAPALKEEDITTDISSQVKKIDVLESASSQTTMEPVTSSSEQPKESTTTPGVVLTPSEKRPSTSQTESLYPFARAKAQQKKEKEAKKKQKKKAKAEKTAALTLKPSAHATEATAIRSTQEVSSQSPGTGEQDIESAKPGNKTNLTETVIVDAKGDVVKINRGQGEHSVGPRDNLADASISGLASNSLDKDNWRPADGASPYEPESGRPTKPDGIQPPRGNAAETTAKENVNQENKVNAYTKTVISPLTSR